MTKYFYTHNGLTGVGSVDQKGHDWMKITLPTWSTTLLPKRTYNDLCFVLIGEFLVDQLGQRLPMKLCPTWSTSLWPGRKLTNSFCLFGQLDIDHIGKYFHLMSFLVNKHLTNWPFCGTGEITTNWIIQQSSEVDSSYIYSGIYEVKNST